MSTPSIIAVADGKAYYTVYCHFNGFLEHVGKMLTDCYSNQDKALSMVKLGNISNLHAEIGVRHNFADEDKGTTFFGRDGGDTDIGPEQLRDKDQVLDFAIHWPAVQHVYVMETNGQWLYYTAALGCFVPLRKILELTKGNKR